MRSFTFLLGLLVLANVATPAQAETWLGDSLEWMTDDSELIVRGKVVKSVAVPGTNNFKDISIHVYELLKGNYKGMAMTIRTPGEGVKVDGEFLFFLKRGNNVYGPKDNRRLVVANNWTQRLFSNGTPYGIIDLNQPGTKGTITADFKILNKGDQILKVVKERVQFTKENSPLIKPAEQDPKTGTWMPALGVIMVDVPWDSQAFKTLYGGSAVGLNVPTDKLLYPKILAQLEKHRELNLVSALANYPGPKTEKLLRVLLNDPTATKTVNDKGQVVMINYPVRAAAYAALLRLGVEVPSPVLSKKPGQ